MKINILTSGFTNGFTAEFAEALHKLKIENENFVFVASEFENIHEKTDNYFRYFLKMFNDIGIEFKSSIVVDSRITQEVAKNTVANAGVLWLAGGDTHTQYGYLETYGLIPIIKKRNGITIGMSAGSINMAKTAICTVTCEHSELKIYPALGLVDISVEPHLDSQHISDELIQLSEKYPIYGMCDDSVIIVDNKKTTYLGDIFLIHKGVIERTK